VTRPTAPQADTDIYAELRAEFGASVPQSEIRVCTRDAIMDLRGSISREALPEMAVRLARVRLAARACQATSSTAAGSRRGVRGSSSGGPTGVPDAQHHLRVADPAHQSLHAAAEGGEVDRLAERAGCQA
jgi:hypothetical protein